MVLAIGASIILAFVYWGYNPESHEYFPKCPFYTFTGLKCPGCGSQRAVHYLLHGEVRKAMTFNVVLVLSIPYLALGFFLRVNRGVKEPWNYINKTLYGKMAAIISLVTLVLWWILRNILVI